MTEIALVISLVATAFSANESRKARKEQKKQGEIKTRIAANKRVRDIKKTIAKSRVDRAAAESAGFQFGVSGGSAVSGATAGIGSDTATSIGAANQQFTAGIAIQQSNDRIAGFQGKSSVFGSIASIAGNFAGPQGQANIDSIASLFPGG